MNIEKKRIQTYLKGEDFCGHITLDKLAIPETVRVTVLGEPLIPESFDIYGHPNFTEEQAMLYMYKEEEIKRQNGGKYVPLKAEIAYEQRDLNVSRRTFDTIEGIEKSLSNLSDLNEMLLNRSRFHKLYEKEMQCHKREQLNEFVIFGRYWLDLLGQNWSLKPKKEGELIINGDVEKAKTFMEHNSERFSLQYKYAIPTADSVCSCCRKTFTIDDVKNNPCVYVNGKTYHDSCWRNYRKLTEIDKLTRQLMSLIYKETDYQFELLPNGYCNQDCCSYIPWLLFHTIDGDIIMGWRKRVISIEWQESYKSFDMNELFDTENVTKWEKVGKRGIHAWGDNKAYEYLKKVVKAVNPDYDYYK